MAKRKNAVEELEEILNEGEVSNAEKIKAAREEAIKPREEEEEVMEENTKRTEDLKNLESLMENLEEVEEDEIELEEEVAEEELTGLEEEESPKDKAINKFRKFMGKSIFGATEIESVIEVGLGPIIKYIEDKYSGTVKVDPTDKQAYLKIEKLPSNFSNQIKEELYNNITADETIPTILRLCVDYSRYTVELKNSLNSLNEKKSARVTDIKRIQKEFGDIMPNIDNATGETTPVSIARYNKEEGEIEIYLSWKELLGFIIDETGKEVGDEPNQYSVSVSVDVNKEDLARSTIQLTFTHNKYTPAQ